MSDELFRFAWLEAGAKKIKKNCFAGGLARFTRQNYGREQQCRIFVWETGGESSYLERVKIVWINNNLRTAGAGYKRD